MVRLLKVFVIAFVAVTVFINGPRIYAHLEFWFHDTGPGTSGSTASAAESIRPMPLPVSDIDQKPLPNRAVLTIDRIGVSVPIVFGVPPVADTIYKNLTGGVVHYGLTPKPGQRGTAVILGHSSLYPWDFNKYGAPFALLGKLTAGDQLTVRYEDGRVFRYTMKQSLVFNPLQGDDDGRLTELEKSSKPLLILVTCWPINTTQSRLAVQAELE